MNKHNQYDITDENLGAYQKVAGYSVNNLTTGNIFITKKISSENNLSFKLFDIEILNDAEIMKIQFVNGLVCRLFKLTDDEDRASSTFDIVDEDKKIIVLKTKKKFVGGIGISEIFYELKFITQWEIPIFTKLCRGFIFGDRESIRNLMKNYNLKIIEKNEYRLKDHLGINQL